MVDYGYGVSFQPLNRSHCDLYLGWRNKPELRRWFRQNDLISQEDHLAWFDGLKDRKDVRMYEVLSNNIPVGVCGLTGLDLVNRRAELSCYVVSAPIGVGAWDHAIKTLLHHGFMAYGLDTIYAEPFSKNPILPLLVEIGFELEGVRRNFYMRDGKMIDAHLYSILKAEFEAVKWRNRFS